jgi:spermidine/putrescine transport system permease protein
MRDKSSRWLSGPYLIWMIGFILIPLLVIVYYGLIDENGSFTLANVAAVLRKEHLKALWLSIWLAALSTVICLIIAYPLGLILRSLKIGKGSFVAFIFILPMWMNFLLRTLAWQTLLERRGVINAMLHAMHLPEQHIINTPAAIVFGMVYNYLPFMILPIYNTLTKIKDNTIHAAEDLGATYLQTLWHVVIPMSLPGIVSGITMVFVPALTTFVVSDLLGGGKILLIGNVIEQEFMRTADWNLGSGLSLVLMCFVIISIIILNRFDDAANNERSMF